MTRRKTLLLSTAAILVVFILFHKPMRLVAYSLFTGSAKFTIYAEPQLSSWRPMAPRLYSKNPHPLARPFSFGRALHSDLHGSDEVMGVTAPSFELAWHAEENLFVSEGPVFDKQGNIYFSPIFPMDNSLIVSLEPEHGHRRWAITHPSAAAGAGTPLVLEDPETGEDIVYLGSYDTAMAIDTNGSIIWQSASGLPAIQNGNYLSKHHSFGINYHIHSDSLITSIGDGHLYIVDRKTGSPLLKKPFMLPGAPTGLSNFTVPKRVLDRANADIAHMVPSSGINGDNDAISAVLHGAAGELQKVSNFFSIDSNSGRIWLAATIADEEDGEVDGFSDYAALYGIDLARNGAVAELRIASITKVPGGTASTPAISADGQRIYIADAYDTVYAIHAQSGDIIWQYKVGDKVTGSIDVAVDNGEIYANTRTDIFQLIDQGDRATLGWKAKLDMYQGGFLQDNFKGLGAEITANGVAFTGAVGVIHGKQKFPMRLGAGLLDRQTGKIRYFADGAEDSVSSTVTAPDGSIYVGNSPLRRVLGRAILGDQHSPAKPRGGISRFKPNSYLSVIKEALWAIQLRLENAAQWQTKAPGSIRDERHQVKALFEQCRHVAPKAIAAGEISPEDWQLVEQDFQTHIASTDDNLTKQAEFAKRLLSRITEGKE